MSRTRLRHSRWESAWFNSLKEVGAKRLTGRFSLAERRDIGFVSTLGAVDPCYSSRTFVLCKCRMGNQQL